MSFYIKCLSCGELITTERELTNKCEGEPYLVNIACPSCGIEYIAEGDCVVHWEIKRKD